jgi:hypothetical protein
MLKLNTASHSKRCRIVHYDTTSPPKVVCRELLDRRFHENRFKNPLSLLSLPKLWAVQPCPLLSLTGQPLPN